jgi:hypothetical protein
LEGKSRETSQFEGKEGRALKEDRVMAKHIPLLVASFDLLSLNVVDVIGKLLPFFFLKLLKGTIQESQVLSSERCDLGFETMVKEEVDCSG